MPDAPCPAPLPERQQRILAAATAEFACHAYADASTDRIAAASGVSKGLLFHYFGSKKALYLRCLGDALALLTAPAPAPQGDFYTVLFGAMAQKLQLCARYPQQTHLVNLASRESAAQVAAEKTALLRQSMVKTQAVSASVMAQAVATLPLKPGQGSLVTQGLLLYCQALVNRYLLAYQNDPDAFFARSDQLQQELRAYMDLMLYGVLKEDTP